MTTVTVPRPADLDAVPGPRPSHRLARVGLLSDLERPRQVFEMLTPNWFASVMGTGIVAVAAARLPVQFPGQHAMAIGFWALASVMLLALIAGTLAHWVLYPANARSHASHPVMAHFYGAAPMAMLTVGAATLLVGTDVVGARVAIDADWTLWFSGTITGLVTAIAVPYLTFTRHAVRTDSAFGGWLMPIVPPMVSASTGALLLPYAPAGQTRLDLLLCCYAMFGLSLMASVIVITLIWYRLAVHKTGEARMVPTLWIVLGPLGQSITAATLLGANAHLAIPAAQAAILKSFGVIYGVPVLGFALLWATIAGIVTARTARDHLPFSLTWWSFTFPVGTCVTGTIGLALATGSSMLRVAAVVFFVALVAAWVLVASRTARGVVRGHLFLPATGSGPDEDASPHAPSGIGYPLGVLPDGAGARFPKEAITV
jgi:C4-dicarboxylate transporter/malic acid transport protein